MARRRSRGTLLGMLVLLLAAGAALYWGPQLWKRYGDEVLATERCTVMLGERTDTKTAEQTNNTALIVAGSIRHGLAARAGTIAIATAIQESSLRNIDYGDRDSIGLFQQRPSQGWGTVEQIMDPYYSTDKFYNALRHVDGWQDMEITVVAQRVQVSGFPDAYADHEEEGRLWASALTGHGGEITCDLGEVPVTTAQAFIDRVEADFGAGRFEFAVAGTSPTTDTLQVSSMGDARLDVALQQWAVAVASAEGVVAAEAAEPGVTITLRTG